MLSTVVVAEGGATERRGCGFESAFAVGWITAGVWEVGVESERGDGIVGDFGGRKAKIITKATHPSAAITAMPNALHFQTFVDGFAAIEGRVGAGGETDCTASGGGGPAGATTVSSLPARGKDNNPSSSF